MTLLLKSTEASGGEVLGLFERQKRQKDGIIERYVLEKREPRHGHIDKQTPISLTMRYLRHS